MRTFKEFPENNKCPICGGDDDGETFLIPIANTREGSIFEAVPAHVDCLELLAERLVLSEGQDYFLARTAKEYEYKQVEEL